MIRSSRAYVLLAFWLLSVSPVHGQPTTAGLDAVADTSLLNYDPNADHGTDNPLKLYDGILLRFDWSSIPDNAAISSATISITFQEVTSVPPIDPKRYVLFDLGCEFDEHEATFNRCAKGKPWSSIAGPPVQFKDFGLIPYQSSVLSIKDPGRYDFEVTELIRSLRKQGRTHINLLLHGEFGYGYFGYVYSREEPDPSKRPQLIIQYSETAPIARPGGPEIILKDFGPVTLDGSASSLSDGSTDDLRYEWTLLQAAPGSTLTVGSIEGTTAVSTFQPDVPGYYRLNLNVISLTGETDSAAVGVTVGLRAEHPRVHLDPARLATIKQLAANNDPAWTRFYEWVRGHPTYSNLNKGITASYLLAYLVTGDKTYVQWTWAYLRPYIYANGTDRAGGLKSFPDIFKNSYHSAAYLGGPFTAEVALFFDWAYPELTAIQKQDLIDWLNAANTFNNIYNPQHTDYFRNDGFGVMEGLATSVFATLGDNPEAPTQMQWFRNGWNEILKAMDVFGKGGAEAEGNNYATAVISLIETADLVKTASGENLFLSHAWFRQRLAYEAFSAYPDTSGGEKSTVPYGFPGPYVEQSCGGGDCQRGPSWQIVGTRARGLPLVAQFPDTEEANLWNWVYRQPQVDKQLEDGDSFIDVLYYQPAPKLERPARLSHFDPSLGYVYVRSDWGADATWLGFWAGPHLDTHRHLNQGAFVMYKLRDLAPETGNYDGGSLNGSHFLAYYARTIGSNGLLIGDPAEVFNSFNAGSGCDKNGTRLSTEFLALDGNPVCPPNEGGQRTMAPLGPAVDTAEYFNTYRDVFDVARVVSFRDDGETVAVVSDLTNAYSNPRFHSWENSPKVTKVYRRLVYLRQADVLLVADTVESTNPFFEKTWLIHATEQLHVRGTERMLSPGEYQYLDADEAKIVVDNSQPSDKNQTSTDARKGFAQLLVKTVFPVQHKLRKVGGRDLAATAHLSVYNQTGYSQNHYHTHTKDMWVKDYSEGVIPNHRSLNWPVNSAIEATSFAGLGVYLPGYGRWRLEVQPTQPAKTDYFLHLLKPSLNRDDVMPDIQRLETDTTFGAVLQVKGRSYSILFSKDTLAPPTVSDKPSVGN
jgi:hypothetical protein